MNDRLDYRADVDGLRAVAIVPVLLFHFGVPPFTGGFVGVDVFFVISGYLITRLILDELGRGRFSFAKFYERRARRLFPALFVTVIACLILSIALLSSRTLPQAAGSAVFALTSLSNFFFWSQSGYFDTQAITKPLLHTWSLSVEEQFYLLWPATIVLLHGLGNRTWTMAAVALLSLISLAACVYVAAFDTTIAFYLTPFRIFEFGLGALVVGLERWRLPAIARECLLVLGLAMIATAVFFYDEFTVFPGLAALVPSGGAALAIFAGEAPITGRLLSNKFSVGIGRISYSLYLAHWPVIVFFDAYFFRTPSMVETIAMMAGTFALAVLSYRYVEMPFRRPNPDRRWRPAMFGLACVFLTLALIVPASWLWVGHATREDVARHLGNGLDALSQFFVTSAQAQEVMLPRSSIVDAMRERGTLLRGKECPPEKTLCGAPAADATNVVIVGDSHAVDAYNAFASAFPGVNFMLMRSQGCAPFDEPRRRDKCADDNVTRDAQLRALEDLDAIVLHMRMVPGRADGLIAYTREIADLGVPIIVTGATPTYSRALPDLYERFASPDDPYPDFSTYRDQEPFVYDDIVRQGIEDTGAVFLELREYFCPSGQCTDYTRDGQHLMVADSHHLTFQAAVELGRFVREKYASVLADAPRGYPAPR